MKTFFLFLGIFAGSCCSPTKLVNCWKSAESGIPPEQFKKVMVFSFVKDEAGRINAENRVSSLHSSLHPSYIVFGNKDIPEDQEKVKTTLYELGYDAVITMRQVLKANNDQWIPATYLGGYYDYQSRYMLNYYRPGYYRDSEMYYIETNLFSLKNDKLIWSGTTITPDPPSLQDTVDEILRKVVKELKKDGLLQGS